MAIVAKAYIGIEDIRMNTIENPLPFLRLVEETGNGQRKK